MNRLRPFNRAFPVFVMTFSVVVVLGCSGSDDNGGENARDDSLTFMANVNQATRQWSREAAGRFFPEVVKQFASTGEIDSFNSAVSNVLCQAISDFEPQKDGKLDSKSDALEFAKKSAFDSAIVGLLEHATAAPPAERDHLLEQLRVEATDPNSPSTKLKGTAALTQAGLLSGDGKLTAPATEYLTSGEGAYDKFRDWFGQDSPGLLQPAGNLSHGIDDKLDKCTENLSE